MGGSRVLVSVGVSGVGVSVPLLVSSQAGNQGNRQQNKQDEAGNPASLASGWLLGAVGEVKR